PIEEESELLKRFRELSQRGRNSIFMTLDALERLAPNIRKTIAKQFKK
ncbi:MAG TPA: transcriptional regulator, partial [Sutterella sp.]|nr:transcriptional regulator [Sutterella sp.]